MEFGSILPSRQGGPRRYRHQIWRLCFGREPIRRRVLGHVSREAIRMDPQQRWLLEAAWEALENSGTPPRKVRGTQVGVFVGISSSDYAALQMPNIAHADVHTISGTTLSIAANRVSYMLDLQGPSLSVDTACSSSLVAVWLAGRSIWSGACDSAIVGGVNALIIPETTLGFSKASMLSPDGQCFAFNARRNGYVRGEGVGAIYIKPLDRALADGNRVYAVLLAAASNQDGHTSSMTVPSADGQAALLREAYQQAGLIPATSYTSRRMEPARRSAIQSRLPRWDAWSALAAQLPTPA